MTARVVVIGLGPGPADLLTAGALDAIARIPVRFVRTARHPSATAVPDALSFDDVYEHADSFADVYAEIATKLVAAAHRHGEILYAVPGSPTVLERSVDHLLADPSLDIELLPGVSFLELVWARLRVDPIETSARLVDGHGFVRAAGERGPLLVAHVHNKRVLSDIKLALDLDGPSITVLQRLGLPDEAVFAVERAELDRSFEPDHLTALWIDDVAAPVAAEVARFDELVHVLRERCPWDREQTHASLTPHLLEETYEVLDALAAVDPETGAGYDHLEEELGDLLFQICFHATLAGENGAFTLADVARGIHEKLVARHPHVFGGEHRDWEEMKREEKGRTSAFDGIPNALPALAYAAKVVGRARPLGVDVPVAADVDAESLGDALLALAAAAKALDVDPEQALRAAANNLRAAAESAER